MKGYCTTSTNCLETINKQLKNASGAGLLTLNSTCRVLRDFKITNLKLHERCIVKGKLNRKRPIPVQREKHLTDILSNFSETCFTIGNLTKTIKSSNIINRQNNIIPVNTTQAEISASNFEFSDNSSDDSS